MKFSVLIAFLCFSLLTPTASDANQKNQIIVVLRYDDYSSRSSTEIEVKIIDTLKKYKIPCTFAVIPYITAGDVHHTSPDRVIPLTPRKAAILKNAIKTGPLDVALHGYSHQTIRENGDYTEFSGSDYHSQCQRIAMGKGFLEQILDTRVLTFVPPWNSYDSETIRCLEKMRFRCISASMDGYATKESSQLKFLPATCELLDLRDAVESARYISEAQSVIVVLFHEYDFRAISQKQGKFTYEEFVNLVEWLTSQEDVQVMSIKEAINVVADLSSSQLILNRILSRLTPPPLAKLINCCHALVNLPLGTKIKYSLIILIFYLAIVIISTVIVMFLGFIVFPRSQPVTYICKYIALALPALCLIYIFFNILYIDLRFPGAIVTAGLMGASIGVWSSCLRLRKQGHLK